MFISDAARTQLNIDVDKATFQALKEEINKSENPDEMKKCYLTNQYYKQKDGIFLSKSWVARAMEKTIESADKIEQNFKQGKLTCPTCGIQVEFDKAKITVCKACNQSINVKREKKRTKLSLIKKVSFKTYIKFLKGKSDMPE